MFASHLGPGTIPPVKNVVPHGPYVLEKFKHSRTRIADNSKADLSFLRLVLSVPGGYVRFLYVFVIAVTRKQDDGRAE